MNQTEIYKINTKTNWGEFAKQRFCIVWKEDMDKALVVEKLVLTHRIKSYTSSGYQNLKEFKGKALCRQQFSIKLTTLNEVIKWMKSISKK